MFIHNTKYYTYLGTHYHKSFPLIWAMKNKAGTGIYCENCICYATEKNFWGENVHMGYCLNCAEHIYENRRKWYQNKEGIKEIIPELTPEAEEEYEEEEYEEEDYEEDYQENPWYANGYDSY